MDITLLKAKLHRARVTHTEVDYEGSCAIDSKLLDQAGILPYEKIDVYNVSNGQRFSTYAIRAEAGSGIISLNGAAAHMADPGDIIIICTFASMPAHEASNFEPTLVYLNESNEVLYRRHSIPMQVA
ncbi:MAG: aspartate 1-decarboxylase [Gammaproteobacteria bacterium]|nr:MAG: aspartate 1-decarboxylase [Gammaproteobacteria bacterium]